MAITRKLIVINSFFKDASVILLNMISSKGTFLKPQILLKSFRTYLKDFLENLSKYDWQNINLLKMFLRIATVSRTNIFIMQSLFNERVSVTGYSLQTLLITFWRKNFRIQVLGNNPWTFFFCLWWNCNYFESTHFRFCRIYITYM